MRRPKKKASIHKWILKNHRQLDKKVRKRIPKSELKSNTICSRQAKVAFRLPSCLTAVHLGWNSLNDNRRSAACRFEWARLQMFMAAIVHPALSRSHGPFYHVTLANKRWRVAPSKATNISFGPPRRKVRDAIQRLRDDGYNPVYVAAYELSADRNLSGNYSFEPHAHILIAGAPKEVLRAAFKVRLSRSYRGRDKPLHITDVPVSELGNLLGYLSKMKAQDRVEKIGKTGRPERWPNRMPAAEKNHWLRCMATMPIAQTIQFGGFAEPLTSQFAHLEMATIIGNLK